MRYLRPGEWGSGSCSRVFRGLLSWDSGKLNLDMNSFSKFGWRNNFSFWLCFIVSRTVHVYVCFFSLTGQCAFVLFPLGFLFGSNICLAFYVKWRCEIVDRSSLCCTWQITIQNLVLNKLNTQLQSSNPVLVFCVVFLWRVIASVIMVLTPQVLSAHHQRALNDLH